MTNTQLQPIEWDELDEIIAREYLRVSFDESGRERSNEEQHDENVPAIERHGWTVGTPYDDVGSASKFAKKRRPGFDQLMLDLEDGNFGAHVLVMWEASRGSRRVSVWSRMLELCEESGVRIYVTQHSKLYDPDVPRDWKTLMDEAVDSDYESRKTSKRVRRSVNANAKAGTVPGGPRSFGYESGGMALAIEPRWAGLSEVDVVRECVRRVLAGDTCRAIATDLNRRGIETARGNAWQPGPLAKMLASPRIAGKRGSQKSGVIPGDAVWPAIIDDVTHKRLIATLGSRSPVGRRGRTPWVLTGFLRCSRCGAPLSSNTSTRGRRIYGCRKGPNYKGCGGLAIDATQLETLLGDLVSERLVDVEARRNAKGGPDDGDELAVLDHIAADRIALAEDKAARRISRDTAIADAAALDRLQREIEQRLAAKTADTAPLDFVIAEEFVGRPWDTIPVERQRLVLRVLIDHVTITPATKRGHHSFDAMRATPGIVWKL